VGARGPVGPQGPAGPPGISGNGAGFAGIDSDLCTYSPDEDAHFYATVSGSGISTRSVIARVDRVTRRQRTIADVQANFAQAVMAVGPDPKSAMAARLFVLDARGQMSIFDPEVTSAATAPLETVSTASSLPNASTMTYCGPGSGAKPSPGYSLGPGLCALTPGDSLSRDPVPALGIFNIQGRSWRFLPVNGALTGATRMWFDGSSQRFLLQSSPELVFRVARFASQQGPIAFVGTDEVFPFAGITCLAYDSNRQAIYAGGAETPFDLGGFE
jgi:hypothetical protein